ncbi:hypothetical protein [Methylobacterium soli]|uniref:Uncharacterized protein n=1 Tax=Methylobacterium soli TaxID=553447 RepID=A0A6L3T0U6_9HYPH|nr:hypothetical protein [Methylobacterium soli]KAB1078394.1 hypothetical protein F6X53_15020 [Methylobacterium soli]
METPCSKILKQIDEASAALTVALAEGAPTRFLRTEVGRLENDLIEAWIADGLDYAMSKFPDLNLNGFRMPSDSGDLHAALRQDLWMRRGAFHACGLVRRAPIAQVDEEGCTSIGLCRVLESSIGIDIPHGALIAAAIAASVPITPVPFTNYAIISIDRRWLTELLERGEQLRMAEAQYMLLIDGPLPDPEAPEPWTPEPERPHISGLTLAYRKPQQNAASLAVERDVF